MKQVLTLTLFVCMLAAGAQDMNNQLTANHVNIPGTRASILLPKGFTLAKTFVGAEKEGEAVIWFSELPHGNFYTGADYHAKENFESKGAIVFEYKELHFDGYPAKYLFGQHEPGKKFRMLTFGDSTFSISIIGFFPSTNDSADLEVKKAIESICYDQNMKVDPLAVAPFKLDESKSTFKFSETNGGYLYYTPGGVALKNIDKTKPVVISWIGPTPEGGPKNVSEELLRNLEQLGNKISKQNEKTFTLNGSNAYEVEAFAEKNGEKAMIYTLVFEGPEKTVSFEAKIKGEYKEILKQIKKLVYTVEWKK